MEKLLATALMMHHHVYSLAFTLFVQESGGGSFVQLSISVLHCHSSLGSRSLGFELNRRACAILYIITTSVWFGRMMEFFIGVLDKGMGAMVGAGGGPCMNIGLSNLDMKELTEDVLTHTPQMDRQRIPKNWMTK